MRAVGVTRPRAWAAAALALVAAGGALFVERIAAYGHARQDHDLAALASVAAAALEVGDVARLRGVPGESGAALEAVVAQLRAIRSGIPAARFVYLVAPREQGLTFLADAESPSSPDYSPPGQLYGEAPQQFRVALSASTPAVHGPYRDRWGEWFTAMVPVRTTPGGPALAVLGVDVKAEAYLEEVAHYRHFALAIAGLFVACVALAVAAVWAVSAQQHRLRALIENIFDVIVVCAPDGTVRYISPSVRAVAGHEPAELKGVNLLTLVHPDDAVEAGARAARIGRSPGVPVRGTARLRHKDGPWIWVETVAVNLAANPAVGGVVVVLRDVTERLEAERASRREAVLHEAMIENVSDIIARMGADGTLQYVSPAVRQALGFEPGAVVGRNFLEFLHPDDRHAATQALAGCLSEPGSTHRVERRYLDKTGRAHVFEAMVTNRMDDPSINALVATLRDVTARRQAEQQVRRLNQTLEARVAERTASLEASARELQGVAYALSHDLRAPLRAIDHFSAFLLEDHAARIDDEGRRQLAVIRASAGRMSGLIDGVLAFVRAGERALSLQPVDVAALAREVFEQQRAAAVSAPTLAVGPLPPACADVGMLRELLAQLLDNAAKFSQGRPDAAIGITGRSDGNENVYAVVDNGPGFDARYAHKLFGVSQRLHAVDEYPGNGIGLAIVRRIAERHGGRAWAASLPGAGATFFFSLPQREPCAATLEAA